MKVAIIGHSYVRDLFHLNRKEIILDDNTQVSLHFTFSPGCSLTHYISKPHLLLEAKNFDPDIVIAIIGGNDIVNSISTEDLHSNCRNFYTFLRSEFPNSMLVGSQVELRFYTFNNRFDCPPHSEFDLRRKSFNTFLKRLKVKDCILQVQGPGRLDDRAFYRDEVHLNTLGLNKYFNIIENTIQYCHNKHF